MPLSWLFLLHFLYGFFLAGRAYSTHNPLLYGRDPIRTNIRSRKCSPATKERMGRADRSRETLLATGHGRGMHHSWMAPSMVETFGVHGRLLEDWKAPPRAQSDTSRDCESGQGKYGVQISESVSHWRPPRTPPILFHRSLFRIRSAKSFKAEKLASWDRELVRGWQSVIVAYMHLRQHPYVSWDEPWASDPHAGEKFRELCRKLAMLCPQENEYLDLQCGVHPHLSQTERIFPLEGDSRTSSAKCRPAGNIVTEKRKEHTK
ncbi:predicted protein [Histoplasma capsulatum G186AR]|uniref:Uncharacterized protein n=1 Tax=Ajellomyces capsulatus (strain G186AR / H82 / ATCC MYA-2454 / RMSCC 2432) TaxID=447093 RepID=C0NWK3_AJECG|nr:uncharacterized protein HCBG_07533 [Histoplasma capsulatum G186AR]EEH04308.1 predicted protein [Histoplasma capsulatum G186AR]